ncbi:MAG TPA: Holliday junction branch migration protein RuvA [Bacteroidia bacterium]|jgi:Holliday junction DNA helicase RuvA|nr:Holliday junction branch migration protein RuvA [Bacteroidia bacterium]
MINHIEGRLIEKSPVHAIIDCNGVGYYINITGNTFPKIGASENCKLLTHVITNQQDYSQNMYGFFDENERSIFRHLISVNGVGASTARMVLSSLTPTEVQSSIAKGEVAVFRNVKGIGEKTAQRIILDLSGKINPVSVDYTGVKTGFILHNKTREEALRALLTLGFAKNNAEKAVDRAIAFKNDLPVEQLVKEALKNL